MEGLKQKLCNILHSTQFCGICLCTEDNMSTVSNTFEIVVGERSHSKTVSEILDVVFKGAANLASTQICHSCTKKLIQSYIFIQQTSHTLRIVTTCLNDLYSKTSDIHNNVFSKENDDSCHYNAIITLDKTNFNKSVFSNGFDSEEEIQEDKTKINCKSLAKNCKSHLRCKICLRKIQDVEISAHLKEFHESSSRLCSICNVAFNFKKDLKRHMEEWHPQRGYKCLTCLRSCTEEELVQHQCSFGCSSCVELPCVHYKYLMNYREQNLNGALHTKCLDCEFIGTNKEALLAHVTMCHLNEHSGDIHSEELSGDIHSEELSGDIHSEELSGDIHSEELESTSDLNAQTLHISASVTSNLKVYESPRKDCVQSKTCKSKELSMPSNNSKNNNKVKSGNKRDIFPCGICNRTFLSNIARKSHMIQTHGEETRINDLKCGVCQKKFPTKADLTDHSQTHGPNIQYSCNICNIQYETLRQFSAHNRKHIGPFVVCEICGQKMRQSLLKKHMDNHADSALTCETCGKSFQNTSLLKYHQKVHLEDVPCPKCDRMINPAKLRRHYRNHIIQEDPDLKAATKQTPNLKCDSCDYKTWNNILLECHMNRHHLKIKPYICDICSKAFIGKHLLKKHIETHSEAKSVACMICMKNFANQTCLKMHLRLHTGERPFTCEICGDRFRSSSILNVHKLKKHSDKNNSCPLCQNKFHSVRDLRRHIIKVHWKKKNKRFNPRELSGLGEEHYHLFHDGRRVKVNEEDLDFYLS